MTVSSTRVVIMLVGAALADGCDSKSSPASPAPQGMGGESGTRDAGSHDAAAPTAASKTSSGEPWQPLQPSQPYAGQDLRAWAIEWCRWHFAQIDCDIDTARDIDGSHCGAYQDPDSPVFFLDSGMPITERSKCVVPQGKAIVVPVADDIIDNAGVLPEDQWSDDEMIEIIDSERKSMRDLVLTIDGVDVGDLSAWAVDTTKFSYVVQPEPNWYSCHMYPGVTGVVDPSYFAGYFVLLPPPSVGTHTLEYAGTLTSEGQDVSAQVRTTLTIR